MRDVTTQPLITNPLNRIFVECLNRHDVKFMVVGGVAVEFYCPNRRDPNDLDLLIEPTLKNSTRVIAAAVGFGYDNLRPEDLAIDALHFPMKYNLYLDILTPKPGGEEFKSLLASSVPACLWPDIKIKVPGLGSLIRMKHEAVAAEKDGCEARQKHKDDLRLLKKVAPSGHPDSL
jgi:hypothetical protein